MKLARLAGSGWLGLDEFDLDLSHPITFFFGDNGSGKSSIAEALRFLLTRTARGTDAAGRGAAQLVRDGAADARLSLAFGDGTQIGARIRGSSVDLSVTTQPHGGQAGTFTGKAAEQILRDLLGPPELLRCLTDAGRVLEMSAKEQSDLLSGVLGEGCTLPELEAHARAAGMSELAVGALLSGISGRLPAGSGVVTPAVLKGAHKACYDKRTEANAAKKKLEGAPVEAPMKGAPVPTAEEVQASRDALEAIENAGFDLRTRHGAAMEAARAQGRLIEQEKQLRVQLEALPKASATAQTELVMGPSLVELELAIGSAKQAEADARAVYVDASALATQRMLEEQGLRAKASGQPLACDGTIGKGKACPLAPAPAAVEPADLSRAQKLLGDAQAAEGQAKTALEQAGAAHVAARDAWTAAQLAASKSEGAAEAQRAALEEQLGQIAIRIENAGETVDAVRALDAAILENGRTKQEAQRALEAMEWVGKQADAHRAYTAQLQEAKEEAALFDELTKALDPRGLPLAILSEKVGPFLTKANATLVQIAPFSIDIDTSDGLALLVIPSEGGKPRSPALLSESERLRVGASLSLALAKVSGLGFCVIDRFDALTSSNRNKLAATVEALGLESVIVLGSYEKPPFEGDEATGVYWVEGGLVNAVEAAQEVGV